MNIIIQQMLSQIIISLILITATHSITKLTYNNCPTEFNPINYNYSLATSGKDFVQMFYANAFTKQTQIQVQNSFKKGDTQALIELVTSSAFMLPYILAAAGFGFIFLCTLCCSIFDRRCPPCQSWRRNYIKQPYSNCEMRIAMTIAVIFSVGILVTTIIIFSSTAILTKDMNMVKCALFYSLDVTLNGDTVSKWGGFGQIQSQVGNITALLNSTAIAINSTLIGNDWIKTGLQDLMDMNVNLWTNNHNSVVFTSDPFTTETAQLLNNPIPTITPLFIQQGLGPNGTAGTMITDIDSAFQLTKQLSAQAYISYKSALLLSNSAANVMINTNTNLQSLTVASNYLNNIQGAINNFVAVFIDFALKGGIYIIQILFGLILLGSLISLLGVISTHIFDILACKKMVNGGWVIFGLLYCGVVIILFFFLGVGGLSYNFCQYYGSIIGSSTSLLTYAQSGSNSAFNKFFLYLDVCFFEDGNILKKFSLAEQMKTVSDMFINGQTYINMQNSGNAQYVDISIAPNKISNWMTVMNNYGQGIYIDANNATTTDSNPHVALNHLNLYTMSNSTTVNTTCANDYWVFDSINCSFSISQSLYTPSNNDSNGVYIPPTGSLCISLNSRLSLTSPTIWTPRDIAYRYIAVRSCKINSTQAYDKIVLYARSLTNYRNSRINLYNSLHDQLSAILAKNMQYNSNITAFTGTINTFFSSVSSLNNLVTNQNNGLTISSNCTVMANSLRFFYNMLCVNFLNRSVKIVVCCIILLVLMIGAVLAGSIFGVRYSRIQKQKKFMGAESSGQIFKDQKMQDSQSGSSNSSSQNN